MKNFCIKHSVLPVDQWTHIQPPQLSPVVEIMTRSQGNHLQTGLHTEDGGEDKVEHFQRIIQLLCINIIF